MRGDVPDGRMAAEEVAMDLDQVVDELYALAPADFTARRDALAAQAKREGDGDLVKQVRALRRPTASAFAVNRLAREASGDLADYVAVGERLREAQAGLDGALLRSVGRERQEASAALVDTAASLVDGGLTDAARQEVEETLRAAVADPSASAAVASGRLTKPLSYAGFGEVDITAATATPLPPALKAVRGQPEAREPAKAQTAKVPERAKARSGAGDHVLAERRELAERQLSAARDEAHRAREAAERATAAAQEAATAQQRAESDVDDLRDRLGQARIEARRAQQHHVTAQSERAAADRAAQAAERELQKAERRRGSLGGSDETNQARRRG